MSKIKTIQKIFIIGALVLFSSVASALTKPGPNADIDNLTYVFYLYYDKGQLIADRDYEMKYDVLEEIFYPESPAQAVAYKGEIVNFKSEVVKTFLFDPKKGNPAFTKGKIAVKGPYAPDGLRAQFYDNQGKQLLTIFINAASICNDDGSCDSVTGENEKTCPNDCKKPRATPVPSAATPISGFLGDFDIMTIVTYVVGGVGVAVIAWFGWRWRKKKREESFLPPPSSPSSSITPPSPPLIR